MLFKQWNKVLSTLLACVMIICLFTLAAGGALAAQEVSQSQIPNNPTYDRKENIGEFAWETFVALNSPVDCETAGEHLEKPRVWEFYHFPKDVFLEGGKKPDLNQVIPPQCTNENPIVPLHYSEVNEDPTFARQEGEGVSRQEGKEDGTSYKLAFEDVLVDPEGNYVLSEVRINLVEFQQIFRNQWYSALALTKKQFNNDVTQGGNPFQLMCSSKGKPDYAYYPKDNKSLAPCKKDKANDKANDKEGAIEVKAAWMVLDPKKKETDQWPDWSKYYTTSRRLEVEKVVDKNKKIIENTIVEIPVALIGFHILHKTSRLGWVWSTFEHVNNAPYQNLLGNTYTMVGVDCYEPDQRLSDDYNLYRHNPESTVPVNESQTQKPYLWNADYPYAMTEKKGEIVPQASSQIARQVCIPEFANELNEYWHNKLKDSIWENYQLIGVQWLENPKKPSESQVKPYNNLINVALEPFPKNHENGFSCVGCHRQAHLPVIKSDFSFLINNAKM